MGGGGRCAKQRSKQKHYKKQYHGKKPTVLPRNTPENPCTHNILDISTIPWKILEKLI